jgi:histidyl-tRNA synthetase
VSITAIKGFNDILPGEVEKWQHIEASARDVFSRYGFAEIRVPIMEKTELFARSIGDVTDIVEKEMYSFIDKGENRVTLRPEGTAGVIRALIENRLYAADPVSKLFYMGPMFRYERPQKGRYRQFHQIGAEITGIADPKVDAQILTMLRHLFDELGITEPSLEINSLGCPECRPRYRETLQAFLRNRIASLCPDCTRRFDTNPLRVLDCKVERCKAATADAPAMLENLCPPCAGHFEEVQQFLQIAGTAYRINKRMVRGLDYYTRTTFELVTGLLGSQSAVAAGGRYDGLVADLGGPAIPGIGFAMGVERISLLLEAAGFSKPADLFIVALGDAAGKKAFQLMCRIQRLGFAVELDYDGKSMKSQMRRADKLACRYTLIVGETELATNRAPLKEMATGSQTEVPLVPESIVLQLQR